MNSPDVLGKVLSEAIIALDKNDVKHTIKSTPMRVGDENKIKRVIRQRINKNSNTTELLIAYF